MKVFSYFNQVPGIRPDPLFLELWAKSWAKYGWTPVLYGPKDALEIDADAYNRIVASRELARGPGGVFSAGYNAACHARWIAYSKEDCLSVDYDLMNNNFTPEDLQKVIKDQGTSKPIYFMGRMCPCSVYATAEQSRENVRLILQHAEEVDSGKVNPMTLGGELPIVAHDQAVFARWMDRWNFVDPPLAVKLFSARSKLARGQDGSFL